MGIMKPRFVEVSHISPVLHEKIRNKESIIFCCKLCQYLQSVKKIMSKGLNKKKNEKSVVIRGAFCISVKDDRSPANLARPI